PRVPLPQGAPADLANRVRVEGRRLVLGPLRQPEARQGGRRRGGQGGRGRRRQGGAVRRRGVRRRCEAELREQVGPRLEADLEAEGQVEEAEGRGLSGSGTRDILRPPPEAR